MAKRHGKVYLIGAGPGDPGLVTVRGLEVLQRADVVVYDHLANASLLRHAPNAEHIYVGKRPDRHTLPQEEISRVLVEKATEHDVIARLKGGDAFVFGRGGEEALALTEAGVPIEVIPGITAGLAAPAYAGIPVTHRRTATSVTFITGHREPGHEEAIDFAGLPKTGTLVVYMGVKNLSKIAAELVRHGWKASTPVAAIQWGTYTSQRTVTGTLADIAEACVDAGIESPAIIVVGAVVDLREQLSWFESRPLYGLRVAVTRARTRGGKLVGRLRDLGADVFEFPTLQITPAPKSKPFPEVSAYDWVLFGSVNAVETFFEQLLASGADVRDLRGVNVCAIGKATEDALTARALRVDCVPDKWGEDEVVSAMVEAGGDVRGQRVLMPRADLVRSALVKALQERGCEVTELQTYTTEIPEDTQALVKDLQAFAPHCVTLTSSANVLNFCEMVSGAGLDAIKQSAVFASLGPATTATAKRMGLPVAVEPARHDLEHLLDAIAGWYATRREATGD